MEQMLLNLLMGNAPTAGLLVVGILWLRSKFNDLGKKIDNLSEKRSGQANAKRLIRKLIADLPELKNVKVVDFLSTETEMSTQIPYGEVADYARDSIMAVLLDGDRRGKTGWETVTVSNHLLHAYNHIVDFVAGDDGDNHLENAQTRIAMARALLKIQQKNCHVMQFQNESGTPQKRLPLDEFTAGELDK